MKRSLIHFHILGDSLSGNLMLLVFRKLGIPATLASPDKLDWPSLIILPPNAIKVLRWLGLDVEVNKLAVQIDRHDLVNGHGRPLRVMGPGFYTDPSGLTIQVIEGAKFQMLIEKAVIQSKSVSVKVDSEEDLTVEIETRPWMIEHELETTGNRFTGYWLTEGVTQFTLPLTMATSITDVWTPNGRLRLCPLNDGRVFWQLRIPRPAGLVPPEDVLGWMKTQMAGCTDLIHSFISGIERIQLSKDERVKWVNTSVYKNKILAGEAKVQLAGESLQAQAVYLEEAFQLAHYLAKSPDWMANVVQYQKKCSNKPRLVFSDEWWTSQFHRSHYGRYFLKMLLWFLPEKALKQQLTYLYKVNGLDGTY